MLSFLFWLSIVLLTIYVSQYMGKRKRNKEANGSLARHIRINLNTDFLMSSIKVGEGEDEFIIRRGIDKTTDDVYINDRLWLGCLRMIVNTYKLEGGIKLDKIEVDQILWIDHKRNDSNYSYKVTLPCDYYFIINFPK